MRYKMFLNLDRDHDSEDTDSEDEKMAYTDVALEDYNLEDDDEDDEWWLLEDEFDDGFDSFQC